MKLSNKVIIILLLTLALFTAGCAVQSAGAQTVTFQELYANLDKYNGKTIALEGYYFHGWEVIVLAERLEPSGLAPDHVSPRGKFIWVEGSIPKDIFDSLPTQSQLGPTEHFGKMRIEGKFETGGQYGHLGAYESHIIPEKVELLLPSK